MSLFSWKFLLTGHGLMLILLVLATVSITFMIERLLFFRQFNTDVQIFMEGIRHLVVNDNINEAVDICEREGSPAANIIRSALLNRSLSPGELKTHVKSVALLQIPSCEQRILSLRIIAKMSPILGLIGVIISFFIAFSTLQSSGINYNSSSVFSEEITSSMLLITVSLAINAFSNFSYAILYGKVKSMTYQLEWTYNEILQILFAKK